MQLPVDQIALGQDLVVEDHQALPLCCCEAIVKWNGPVTTASSSVTILLLGLLFAIE